MATYSSIRHSATMECMQKYIRIDYKVEIRSIVSHKNRAFVVLFTTIDPNGQEEERCAGFVRDDKHNVYHNKFDMLL